MHYCIHTSMNIYIHTRFKLGQTTRYTLYLFYLLYLVHTQFIHTRVIRGGSFKVWSSVQFKVCSVKFSSVILYYIQLCSVCSVCSEYEVQFSSSSNKVQFIQSPIKRPFTMLKRVKLLCISCNPFSGKNRYVLKCIPLFLRMKKNMAVTLQCVNLAWYTEISHGRVSG